MRVAVIGGSGHIGTWLVPMLSSRGYEVLVLSRSQRGPYHSFPGWDRVELVEVDRTALEREGTFGRFVSSLRCDVVIDLICFDVSSAVQIVDAVSPRVSHFLHCGTLWVHGNPPFRPYDETSPREPFGDYGIRKAEVERFLLERATDGFPVTILHPGHITGPGWSPINPAGHLDPLVFSRLERGEVVEIPDDGAATLQHVHAADVAQAFLLAVENPRAAIGEAFHVAARDPVTMRDYAAEVAGWFNRPANLSFLPFDEWRNTVSARDAEITRDHILHSPHASIAKAERLLGFIPRFTATGAVKDALGIV